MLQWLSLREQLESLGYTHAAQFVASCTARISTQLHEKRWPPVWYRFLSVDADFSTLSTYFFRMDGEGMFFGDGPDGYRAERSEILERVRHLHAQDEAARKERSHARKQHAGADT